MIMSIPVVEVIIYVLSYFAVGITAIFPSITNCVNVYVIVVLMYSTYKDRLVCLAPLFLFFNSTILYFNGIAISNIYFALFTINEMLRRQSINKKSLHLVLLMFSIYAVVVVSNFSIMLSIEFVLIFIFVTFLLENVYSNDNWELFVSWYLAGLFSASLYGLVAWGNNIANGVTRRFMLAFTDPNYAGMFLSIGAYLVLYGEVKNTILKCFLLIVIALEILITMSSTAILCNLLVILFIIIDNFSIFLPKKNYRINIKRLSTDIIGIILIVVAIVLVKKMPDSIMSDSVNRFFQKMAGASAGLSESTTGRSDLWAKHMRIFQDNSDIWRWLFGGYFITDRGFDSRYFTVVSHEVYVDSLLCFGVVGTTVYVISILKEIVSKWRNRSLSKVHKQIFIVAVIWLIYSLGLSMFPFWGFSFMLFVTVQNERNTKKNG